MDSNETITPTDETNGGNGELNHSDKLIGVFTEPSETFSITSKFPPRTKDWILPVLFLLIAAALVQIILTNNEEIVFQTKQKQMKKIEAQFDQLVESGAMSREQANEQLDKISEQMDQAGGTSAMIRNLALLFVFGFLIFIIYSGIYFALSKAALKGEGQFSSALVANGLASYIGIIHVILAAVLSLLLGRLIPFIDLTAILDVERASFMGFLLSKVDPFSIWMYTVLGIGLSKMFHSTSSAKYIAMVMSVWVGITFLFFLLAQAVPFLQFFMQ